MLCLFRAALDALALTTAAAVPALAQAAAPAPQQGAAARIAFVNSQVIASQAPGMKEATEQVQKQVASYRQEVQRMSDSLNTLVADYGKQEATLTPTAKEARQKAIRAKEAEYQARARQLEDSVQRREREVMRPLMERINKTIEAIRAEEGYAMIFDAGSNAGVVVAADKSLDITDSVLARLKTARPVSARPTTKPGEKPSGAPVSSPAGVSRPKTPPAQP